MAVKKKKIKVLINGGSRGLLLRVDQDPKGYSQQGTCLGTYR